MSLPSLRPGARILFISNTRVGDVVLSTGLLGYLADAFPTARFTVVAGYLASSLFEGVPFVERVVPLRKRRYDAHWLELYLRLLRPWDLVVDLRGSASGWLIPTRHRRTVNSSDPGEPRVVELARLLDADPPPAPRVWLQPAHRQAAARLVPADRQFLAVAPGAAHPAKRWPADRFADLVNRLTEPDGPCSRLAVVLLGDAEERPLVEAVLARLADRPGIPKPAMVVAEPLLPVVAAVLERARLYVGNDSGLMHLAAAAGAPTVGLFGPTPPARYRPWGERTLAVQPEAALSRASWSPRPIDELGVEQVVASVGRFAAGIGLAPDVETVH
jgi:ADP-heptose:LPS heptosyltransferase